MNFRVRSKNGTTNVRAIDGTTTLAQFKKTMETQTGVPATHQRIRAGYPPKEILNPETDPISSIFSNGDLITLEQSDTPTNMGREGPLFVAEPSVVPTPIPQTTTTTTTKAVTPPDPTGPGFVSIEDGGVFKRVIPDDNSCLFHAISYVLENQAKNKANDLRKIIAHEISLDPFTYNEAILGKNPTEYQRWIQQSNSWGGSVELNIFAKYYKCEIMAYDVTRQRGNCFAEDQGYTQRVYLIYDGIHYDCLVWNLLPSNPLPELDITVFNSKDTTVAGEFEQFMRKEHASGRFVDEYNYTLKCNDCGKLLVGNKEAVVHAQTTGHKNFGQYSN